MSNFHLIIYTNELFVVDDLKLSGGDGGLFYLKKRDEIFAKSKKLVTFAPHLEKCL